MIKEVVRDVSFLSLKSENANRKDKKIIKDLEDTLKANLEDCVGMAGNMIGERKRILVFSLGNRIIPMVNPIILEKKEEYETEESCLSLEGFRKVKRYNIIKVKYLDENFKEHIDIFRGFTAQIIQHEIDHFEGVII